MPKCPTCKRAFTNDGGDPPFPFCSQRCKLVDLDGWLSGRYVVSEALPLDEEDSAIQLDEDN